MRLTIILLLICLAGLALPALGDDPNVTFTKEGAYWKVELPPFSVYSSLNKTRTRRFLRAITDLHEAAPSIYGGDPVFNVPPKIYLLEDRREYFQFIDKHKITGVKYGAGFFSPRGNMVALYWQGDTDPTTQLLLHELSHLYVSALLQRVPQAINEGLSKYIEAADYRFGRFKFGTIHKGAHERFLQLVRKNRVRPLPDLLGIQGYHLGTIHEAFGQDEYAQSWALVWYCLNGSDDIFKRFREYCLRVRSVPDPLGKIFLETVVGDATAFREAWVGKMSETGLDSKFRRQETLRLLN